MHLDHLLRARQLVEPVDVLRHDGLDETGPLEGGEREMGRVRPSLLQDIEPARIEVPHLDGVAAEGLDGCVLGRVVSCPDAARRPEVRDAALGRNAGAGENAARLMLADQRGEALG